MLNFIKKIFKTLSSRLIYLFVGLSFAVVIIAVQAAISSSTVSGGTPLTAARWNTMVADLQSLDSRVTTLETSGAGTATNALNMKAVMTAGLLVVRGQVLVA